MSPWPGFYQSPTSGDRVIQHLPNMLVWMIVHELPVADGSRSRSKIFKNNSRLVRLPLQFLDKLVGGDALRFPLEPQPPHSFSRSSAAPGDRRANGCGQCATGFRPAAQKIVATPQCRIFLLRNQPARPQAIPGLPEYYHCAAPAVGGRTSAEELHQKLHVHDAAEAAFQIALAATGLHPFAHAAHLIR